MLRITENLEIGNWVETYLCRRCEHDSLVLSVSALWTSY